MENKVFQDPAVAGELSNFIEARLHVDGSGKVYEDQLALHMEMNETSARPYFVVVNPGSLEPIQTFPRALVIGESYEPFVSFLRKARGL